MSATVTVSGAALAPLGGKARYSARIYDDGLGMSHVACSCGWQSGKHYGMRAQRKLDARRDASEHMRAHLEPGEVVMCGSDVRGVWCELWPRGAAVDALRALGRLRRYATVTASVHAMLRGIPRVSGTGVVVRVGGLELPVESIREVHWS